MKVIIIVITLSLLLSGCSSKEETSSAAEPDYSADPVIQVVYDDAPVKKPYMALSGVAPSTEPVTPDPVEPEAVAPDPVESEPVSFGSGSRKPDTTLKDISYHYGEVAAVAIMFRTILNEYLGAENYSADFRYDHGTINIPRDKVKSGMSEEEIEESLHELMAEVEMGDYPIEITFVDKIIPTPTPEPAAAEGR